MKSIRERCWRVLPPLTVITRAQDFIGRIPLYICNILDFPSLFCLTDNCHKIRKSFLKSGTNKWNSFYWSQTSTKWIMFGCYALLHRIYTYTVHLNLRMKFWKPLIRAFYYIIIGSTNFVQKPYNFLPDLLLKWIPDISNIFHLLVMKSRK